MNGTYPSETMLWILDIDAKRKKNPGYTPKDCSLLIAQQVEKQKNQASSP